MAVSGVRMDSSPPLTPDGEEARRWAEQELSDPVYTAAEPTPLDRIARAVGDFIAGLFQSEVPGGWASTLAVVAAIVIVVLIVVAFLIWGRPRVARRSRLATADLFGDSDRRTAEALRRAAAAHAARAEWDDAIVLRFRALARGLDERGAVETPPGATVHAFARAAGRVFPASAADLERAASGFDDVRYLRRPGTDELYRAVVAVDDRVRAETPALAGSLS